MENFRNIREAEGKFYVLQLPEDTLSKIDNVLDSADGIVDAKVVMDELGICKKSLANLIACGKISRDMYTVAVNGVKKFFIRKILGLEK